MTFEEWRAQTRATSHELMVWAAWQAAQEAERRRIYQILDRVAIDANHKEWDECCFTVKDRITGGRND